MHPTEIIELMIVGTVIGSIIIISIFLKGKWRKVGWSTAIVILIGYCIFLAVRPLWIDAQIDNKVRLLESYLEDRYPGEEWTISSVPFRKDGYKHLNPYNIGVTFESEPEATYHYRVESKDNIYQVSYSTNNGLQELKHLEEKVE